jgi:hypothetical protein
MPTELDTERDDAVLARHLEHLRDVDLHATWPPLRDWVRLQERQARRQAGAGRGVASRLLLAATSHPMRLAAAMGLAMTLIACVSPVEHQVTLGYTMSGRIALPPAEARARLGGLDWVARNELEVLGVVTAMVGGREEVQAYVGSGRAVVNGVEMVTPTSRFVVSLASATREEVDRYRAGLAAMPGVDSVRAEPIRQEVTEPLYRVALRSMSYEFPTDLAPEAVEAAVRRHLLGLGMESVRVRYITRDGQAPAIELSVDGNPAPHSGRIEDFLAEVGAPGH